LPKLFTKGVLIPLVDAGMIEIKSIKWMAPVEEEDDYVESEGHFKVMAHFIHAKKLDATWFASNCKVFLEKTYVEAVSDVNYLIEELSGEIGIDNHEAADLCATMGLKAE